MTGPITRDDEQTMKPLRLIAAGLALTLWAQALPAQSQYNPAIMVNEDAITFFEIDQRIRMLDLFNTPGDLPELAREQLVEERLKRQALRAARLQLTEEALARELENFASRANLPYDQFLGVLQANGIAEQSLADFVEIGVTWRDYVRTRYRSDSEISNRDVELAIENLGGSGRAIEVLLSEIIIAAPPERAAEAEAIARQISTYRSTASFSAAAREYSALPSRTQGGQLGWLPLDNYPASIRGLLLELETGEVTDPLPIPNGIALFQLRGIREVSAPVEAPASIDHAILSLPGGAEGRARGSAIAARADTCDDLYTQARGLPPEQLLRADTPPDGLPQDIAIELARLDPGEVSMTDFGTATRLVMLCRRNPAFGEGQSEDGLRNALRSQRLSGFADLLIAELKAEASIRSFE